MKQKKQDSTTSGQLFSKKKLNFGVRLVKTFHFYMNFTNYSFTYTSCFQCFNCLFLQCCFFFEIAFDHTPSTDLHWKQHKTRETQMEKSWITKSISINLLVMVFVFFDQNIKSFFLILLSQTIQTIARYELWTIKQEKQQTWWKVMAKRIVQLLW